MEERMEWCLAGAMVLLLLASWSSASHCPLECVCHPLRRNRSQLVNNCSNRSLEVLPEHYSHHTVKLDISYNRFTKLDEDFFGHGSRDLATVYLNNNSISSIAETTFWTLPALWSLDLSGNKLESLTEFTFKLNTQLSELALRGNNLKIPANTAFLKIPNLEKLDLSYNNLEALDANTFYGMSKLKNLFLNNNKFHSLSKTWFRNLAQLKNLFLEDNNLQHIDPDTFVYLKYLTVLDLSRNKLMIPPRRPFLRIMNLQWLYLNGCNLTFIADEMFEMLTSLRYLFLSDNQIKIVDLVALKYFDDLQYMNMCNNRLTCDCGLKDAWEWFQDGIKRADVSCSVSGEPQEACAGRWDAVAHLQCNITTVVSSTNTSASETQSITNQPNNTGMLVGIGITLLLLTVAGLGYLYWQFFTRRRYQWRNSSDTNRRLSDMFPFENEQDNVS